MSEKSKQTKSDEPVEKLNVDVNYCGIIMPIAAMGDYEKGHWERVRQIIDTAVIDAGFTPNMVSESADIGVIHSRIVQNIYNNPIVVCDVSGKNPNVMFELGLRLAFDKPVIIIKDDATNYSFDTSPIEHLEYRRDLRYQDSMSFIERLTARIKATVAKRRDDPNYSPFLRHFGTFTVAELQQKTGSAEEVLLAKMDELQRMMAVIGSRTVSMRSGGGIDGKNIPNSKAFSVILRDALTPLATNQDKVIKLDEIIDVVMPKLLKNNIDMTREELRKYILGEVAPILSDEELRSLL